LWNGWIMMVGGFGIALIGAVRADSVRDRPLGVLSGAGMAAVGMWSVRYSRTMRPPRWVELQEANRDTEVEGPTKLDGLHDRWLDQ
jgi:hypothetical protein